MVAGSDIGGDKVKGRTPNKEEKTWLDAITSLGCIVCYLELGVFTEASPHHISGKTKPGAHLKTYPLCGRHHQIPGEGYKSRHGDGRYQFEQAYGTESYLLDMTAKAVGLSGFMDGF
jgi:hypothetical protein